MSRAAELAREEADRVEADERDGLEPDAETDAGEPSPAAAVDPEGEPDPVQAVAGIVADYIAGMQRVMGDDFEAVHQCPYCTTFAPGLTFEQLVGPPDYVQDETLEQCKTCNGWGVLLTGAKNESSKTRPCTSCGGSGYLTITPPGVAQAIAQPAAPAVGGDLLEQLRAAGYVVVPPPAPWTPAG